MLCFLKKQLNLDSWLMLIKNINPFFKSMLVAIGAIR